MFCAKQSVLRENYVSHKNVLPLFFLSFKQLELIEDFFHGITSHLFSLPGTGKYLVGQIVVL